MKKTIIFAILFLLIMSSAYALTETGRTISVATNPKGYGQQETTWHYILTGSSALYEYNYQDFTLNQLVGATASITYIGNFYHENRSEWGFLFTDTSVGDTNVRYMRDTGANLGNVALYNLNDYTPAENTLETIRDVEINDTTIIVFDANKSTITRYNIISDVDTFISFTHLYETDVTSLNLGLTLHGTIFDGEYYLYDEENYTIYRLNALGDVIQTLDVPTSQDTLKDIFFWNESLWIVDKNDDLIREYNYTLITPPPIYDGVYYNLSNYCTSATNLCNNTIVDVDVLGNLVIYCNETSSVTYCSDGCVNTESTYQEATIINGECSQLACTSECNVLNQQTCETPNTYSICVQGVDGCLIKQYNLFCPANYVCEDSAVGGTCVLENITQTGRWIQEYQNVNINLNSTNAYDRNEQTIKNANTIATTPITTILGVGAGSVAQIFLSTLEDKLLSTFIITTVTASQPQEYVGLSCDFTNNLIESDDLNHNNLASYGWTSTYPISNDEGTLFYIDINSTDNVTKELKGTPYNMEVEVMIETLGTGDYNIRYEDNGLAITNLVINYNETAKTLLISDENYGKIFVNETSVQPTDDLTRIVIVSRFMKELSSTHHQINVIRTTGTSEVNSYSYTLPTSYTDSSASTPSTIDFEVDGEGLRVYQVIYREQNGFPAYTTNTQKTCEYNELGCKNVRAYGNREAMSTYHFYRDIVVCGETIATVSGDLTTAQTGSTATSMGMPDTSGMNPTVKLFLAVFISIIVFIAFFVGGMVTGNAGLMAGVGGMFSVISIIAFTLAGFLPAWVLIIVILIGAGIGAYVLRNLFVRG